MSSADFAPTQQAQEVYVDFSGKIDPYLMRLEEVIDKDVSEFENLVHELEVPAIVPLSAHAGSEKTGREVGKVEPLKDTQKDISSKNGKFSWCAEAEQCAAAFKKERDKGSQTSRLDFCIRYAEEHDTKAKGSTLDKKMRQYLDKWDPGKKYGRPKRSKRYSRG